MRHPSLIPAPLLPVVLLFACQVARSFVLEGSATSYAQFRKWNAGLNGTLEFEFKTEQGNGLLLYTDDGGTYDFFEVKLVESALRLRYNLGGGAQIVTVGHDLGDGHWHKVQITRCNENTTLTVDGVSAVSTSRGKEFEFGKLAGNSDVYVGGMPSWYNSKLTLLALPSVIFEPRFNGFIRNLVYADGENTVPRRQEMKSRDAKCGSFPCVENVNKRKSSRTLRNIMNITDACETRDPCQHGGICISTDSGPICECRTGDYEGAYCEKEAWSTVLPTAGAGDYWAWDYNKAPSEASFRGTEYLTIDLSKGEPVLSTQESISLQFKTRQPNGLLFYSGEGEDYLTVSLRDGGAAVGMTLAKGRLDLHIKPARVRFDDNQWHKIIVHRKVQEISSITSFCRLSAIVDGIYAEHGHTAGSFAHLASDQLLVGGGADAKSLQGAKGIINFVGCLRKVEFAAEGIKMELIEAAKSGAAGAAAWGKMDFHCREPRASDPITFTTRDSHLVGLIGNKIDLCSIHRRVENLDSMMMTNLPPVMLPPITDYGMLTPTLGIKRGSDELLSQSGAVSNGASMSPQPHHAADNNNDAKKVKLDKSHSGKPSRVIHIRNIPNEVSEAEIIHLGLPFGRVTNVLVLKGKNQAFLEMADETAAATMVTYYASGIAQLRGRAVYVQFSNHRELKTDQTHSNNAVSSPTNDVANTSENSNNQVAIPGQNQVTSAGETQGGPNTVLRVIVEHMLYPITLDILYQIFTRFGKVLKIVTFTKNSSFQALIQYADMLSAQTAKFSLDGQNVYNSCCTLRIDYSKMQNLNVKYNNDKSRDYTNPNLPTGDANLDAASLALGGELLPQLLMGAGSQPRARIPESIAGAPGVLPTPFAAMHGLPSPLAGPYNGVPPAGGLAGLGGFPLGAAGLGVRVQGSAQASAVLLVSNLNEEMVTPDALFTLFGVYGDVQRVKILYNKKDSALIQMAEPHQALLALTHMDKLRVFGKQIKVMLSKHQTVQLPKEGQPDAGLTKDYTNSTLHRFKKPGSKNYQNIYPPSATLHLSNIPATVAEDEIKDAFTKNGFTVKAFKFFPKDRKMALIQMPNMDDAVAALIKMHNYQLSESNHLRVSFSKSNI